MSLHRLSRRALLRALGAALAAAALRPAAAADWDAETPAVRAIRETLEQTIGGLKMALDFRGISPANDELFRIQINADRLFPVASCFKAWLALYYLLYTPPAAWDTGEFSPVYRTVVVSDNVATGVVLADTASRAPGTGNAIEKFNDFLRLKVGMANGLHTWNWPGSPTVGLSDPRFAPSPTRQVRFYDGAYAVDNAFTAADLGRGYDFLLRGDHFAPSSELKAAIQAARALLAIPAPTYRSPIERAATDGYWGKDGILPAEDIATGRVVNDAGVVAGRANTYILAFMSAGESESTAVGVLRAVMKQIEAYEADAIEDTTDLRKDKRP